MSEISPGIYDGIDNATYHRGLLDDPRPLSASMAKILITKSPADLQWELANRVESTAFDEGQAVHELVLEGGFKTIDVFEYEHWRTNEAKTARDASYAARRHPLLKKDLSSVYGMADAVKSSPLAAAVFTDGMPEQSALAIDPGTGVPLQARPDWLRRPEKGRPIVGELKTTVKGAAPRAFMREVADRHYHLQAAFTLRVLELLGVKDAAFLWVAVSKTAPYRVSVTELTRHDREIGDLLVDAAIKIYAGCLASGEWPGYDTEIHQSALPVWAAYEAEDIA